MKAREVKREKLANRYAHKREEIAAKDACKVEHDLSQETFEKLLAHARQNVQGE